ncbi:MAG: AAA family ATPase [Acidobacteria bacterium]|nr:AAA family ATPase [Acidobacteriota bacterium]
MISELRLRNFKSFGNEPEPIRLAPLTLILGSNSSGKSSILQALLMMRQTWENDITRFIELRTHGRFAPLGRFGNVVHQHEDVPLEIGISWDGRSADFKWQADDFIRKDDGSIDQDRLPEVGTLTSCRLAGSFGFLELGRAQNVPHDGTRRIEIPFLDSTWDPANTQGVLALAAGRSALTDIGRLRLPVLVLDPVEKTRKIDTVDAPTVEDIVSAKKQSGHLRTIAEIEEYQTDLKEARSAWVQTHAATLEGHSIFMQALEREIDEGLFGARRKFSNVRYVGPTRVPGQRVYTRDSFASDEVGARGERLGDVLVRFPDRRDGINLMLKKMGVPYELLSRVLPTLDAPVDLRLRDIRAGDAIVGIPDVGFGVSQLLPILAEWMAMGRGTKRSDTLLIEQPELHLHPEWQVGLVQLLAEPMLHSSAEREESVPQVILETHGEFMVLAVQQLVRLKQLDPNRVSLLAVEVEDGETCVRTIQMAENGEFLNRWPNGFFPQRDALLYEGLKNL